MRNLMRLLLAAAVSLYLPCTAFAAGNSIPCTGDSFPMYTWIAVMILALAGLIAAVIFFWRSLRK